MDDFLCGAIAGAAADSCLFPFDTLRARIISRSVPLKGGMLAEAASLVRSHGFSALYRGLPAHLSGSLPGNGIFYLTYEAVKAVLVPHVPSDAIGHMLAASASCIASLALYTPMEVVKQRVMVGRGETSLAVLKSVLSVGGVRDLYRGLSVGAVSAHMLWSSQRLLARPHPSHSFHQYSPVRY